MKRVYIIGIGVGNPDLMHKKAIDSIKKSECIIGAKRMLEQFAYLGKSTFESCDSTDILRYIQDDSRDSFAVLVSGDTGFYSMSKKLTEKLRSDDQILPENITAISSIQYLCSKINLPWDDMKILSAHGRELNVVSNVMFNHTTFMLTGGENTPRNICSKLTSKGLGGLKVTVGENLSYENERIVEDTACNIAKMEFGSLAVIIIYNENHLTSDVSLKSIRDDEFITGKSPMTKSEVRTVSIGKLNLKSNHKVYDIGAGTGSVAIETALKLTDGTLYAIEKEVHATELIKQNIKKFKTYNVEIVNGLAPECLDALPRPDSVFIGGSGGNMDSIIQILLSKNPYINIVINAITLQSLNEAVTCMEKYKFIDVEIINMSVAKSKRVGQYDMMMGQNPIYVISGRGSGLN